MKKQVIKIENLSIRIDGNFILENINFSINNNEFLGIIGPNGAGKTTLLKIMLGLIKPNTGLVEVFGKTPLESRKKIGYVPQLSSFDMNFPINVFDTVLMGCISKKKIFCHYSKKDKESAEKALKTVEMFDLRYEQIGNLSGGQRQRVFIARALVSEPKLLLLDEPTASVDPKIKTDIYDLFKKLKQKMSIILVTHDMGVISSYVDKIACLSCNLYYHDSKEISKEVLEEAYHCPVDIIAHGLPHRVLKKH